MLAGWLASHVIAQISKLKNIIINPYLHYSKQIKFAAYVYL